MASVASQDFFVQTHMCASTPQHNIVNYSTIINHTHHCENNDIDEHLNISQDDNDEDLFAIDDVDTCSYCNASSSIAQSLPSLVVDVSSDEDEDFDELESIDRIPAVDSNNSTWNSTLFSPYLQSASNQNTAQTTTTTKKNLSFDSLLNKSLPINRNNNNNSGHIKQRVHSVTEDNYNIWLSNI